MIKKALIVTTIIFTGCSKYINYLESSVNPDFELKPTPPRPSYCQGPQKYNIIHNSSFTFKEFPKEILNSDKLNIFDKGAILTFFQFYVRPDSTDWSSRVQIHGKIDGKQIHQEFGSFARLPLFEAFKFLENEKFFSKNLRNLLWHANNKIPRKLTIQKNFNQYLTMLEEPSELITKRYFKLNNPLQAGETFTRPILKYPSVKFKDIKFHSQTFQVDNESNFKCSFDTGLYKKGIFLISKEKTHENIFGITTEEGDYFIIATKKIKSKNSSYKEQEFLGKASKSISPFCRYDGINNSLLLLGLNSRDPGQLLYHLYNYGIQKSDGPEEVLNYLNYPRHQFLIRPSRLLYESKKGTEKQLRYFLSLDFPIYHTNNLGAVHALWRSNSKNEVLFIADNRTDLKQTCYEK